MVWIRLRLFVLVSFAAPILVVGCGQGNALSSPTAPTATLGSTAVTADDGFDVALTASSAGDDIARDLDAKDADVRGAVSGLTGTCPTLSFMVGTTKVTTTSTTDFHHIACAALTNGLLVEAEGKLQADGSIAAHKVKVEQSE